MVLSDVEETVTIVEVEDDNEDEAVRVSVPPRISTHLRNSLVSLSLAYIFFY